MSEQYRATARMRVESVVRRLVSGPLVPLEVDTVIDAGTSERFERRAFAHLYRAPNRVQLRAEHRNHPESHIIGGGVKLGDAEDSLWGEFKVVRSPLGDEWLALASDEDIETQWSVGFLENRSRWEGRTLVHSRADLFELAFVQQGAYGSAARVTAVREGTPPRLIDTLPPLPKLRPVVIS